MPRKIILASQSKQRFNLLKASLSSPIEVCPADLDEQAVPFVNQYDKAEKIALAKAKKVATNYKDMIIVAADTFCYVQGKILEKPQNTQEAKKMLAFQSGKEIEALTGYAFLDTKFNLQVSGCEKVLVKMRQLSEDEIERYVANEPVLTWSAAFSPAYDSGMALIENINGNLTAFSHGLPINLLMDFLSVNQK